MSTRARFYIGSVTEQQPGSMTVSMNAVCRGTENAEWAQFTPAGSLSLTLNRKATAAQRFFKDNEGREVFIDISLATDPVCTECGETIERSPATTEEFGTGLHGGNDVGYIPGEFVHNRCLAPAKRRLGL